MKISVVLCTYNGERYLRQQLDSVFAQTLRADEVLVSDDGSTDGTWSILTEYAVRYPEMRLRHNDAPHGVNANFYSAMRCAKGELLVLGDQDDIWLPDKVQCLVDSIGDALLVASMNRPFVSSEDLRAVVSHDERVPNVSLLRMLHTSCVAGHTMALRPSLLSLVPPSFEHTIMYDAMLQIVANAAGRMVFVPRVLVLQRRHTDSATYTAPIDRSKTVSNIVHTIIEDCRLYRRTRSAWHNRMLLMQEILSFVASRQPVVSYELHDALCYVSLQLNGNYLQRTLFCMRHHKALLHSVESNTVYSLLRALFFPISSAVYVR